MGEIGLMQKIGDILGVEAGEEINEAEYEQRKCDRYNQHKGELKGMDCSICNNKGDVVIDPVAGSGTTLRVCMELNRHCYGFEIYKDFYSRAINEMLTSKNEMRGQITLGDLEDLKHGQPMGNERN